MNMQMIGETDDSSTPYFSAEFLDETIQIIESISEKEIEHVVQVIRKTRDIRGRLFLAGSGGGAGHASHAACDFRKLCGIEAYCVTDNVSELTARTNDDGWDSSYRNWLEASRMSSSDCLFVFSVGGGSINPPVSTNLVAAAKFGKEVGASVVGVVGRDGGAVRSVADATVLIPSLSPKNVTPQTEGLQAVVWHLIVSHPTLASGIAKWEGLSQEIK